MRKIDMSTDCPFKDTATRDLIYVHGKHTYPDNAGMKVLEAVDAALFEIGYEIVYGNAIGDDDDIMIIVDKIEGN